MNKTIIFGNGVNDLLFKKDSTNVKLYFNQKMKKYISELQDLQRKSKRSQDIAELILFFDIFNAVSFQEGWQFDELYKKALDYEAIEKNNTNYFQHRLQDLIKSILNEWLIEEFGVFEDDTSSKAIIEMINSFEHKNTTNYAVSKLINKDEVNFLHGSFYEKDKTRKDDIKEENTNNFSKASLKKIDLFFKEIPYTNFSNKYGLNEMEIIDNPEPSIDPKLDKKARKKQEKRNKKQKRLGNTTIETNSLQKEDYNSYDELIVQSNIIVFFGINPYFDNDLVKKATQKSNKIIFVYHNKKDKEKALELIDENIDEVMPVEKFIKTYKKINFLEKFL